MPEKSQIIAVPGYDIFRLLAIAYGTFQELGWTTRYAGNNVLLGYTAKKGARYGNEITIKTDDSQVTVTSKMIHGEAFDIMGRTKKDVADFLSAFDATRIKATDQQVGEWNEKIALLKEETIIAAQQELKQAEEVDKVMNLSKGSRKITYGIIALNVLVFLVMVIDGVAVLNPTVPDIARWGANFSPLTLSGDWWRLITCMFIHIGIVHLLFNMYALYMVGLYLEPMLGVQRYLVAYICSGVFASLASLWWHKDPVASAGASGAIFGMYGVFLALLSTSLIPKNVRNSLLQSIGIFVVYNLVYGMKSGVDNAAHIGGLISGLVIGYVYYPGLKTFTTKSTTITAAVLLLTAAATFFYVKTNPVPGSVRKEVLQEIEQAGFRDADKYSEQFTKFAEAEERALAPLFDSTLTDQDKAGKLKTDFTPEWEKASEAVEKMKTYNVSEKAKATALKLEKYIALRKEYVQAFIQWVEQKDSQKYQQSVELNRRIDSLLKEK